MKTFAGLALFGLLVGSILTAGCAGSTAPTPQTLTTSPGTSNLRIGDPPLQFSALLNGATTSAVTWSTGGVVGGNAIVGTIDATGLFTPPAVIPSPNTVAVQAVSTSNASLTGSSMVTLENPIPVVTSVSPSTIGVGTTSITVAGSKFVSGAMVLFGGVLLTPTSSTAAELTVAVTTSASQVGNVPVTVQNPNPGLSVSTTSAMETVTTGSLVTSGAAARFLEQTTFGPTSATISQLQQIGFPAFLTNQLGAPISTYPDPAPTVTSLLSTQEQLFINALTGQDQLRQRVALALSEIWVTSGFTVPPQGMAPYMRLLSQDAFANYRTLMFDVTLSPAMGRYLDMVNNNKPPAGQHANENYARETMQLFTLGLDQLNLDGSLVVDGSNNPIPTYTQDVVEEMALAFTGWTYAASPNNWLSPMVVATNKHDMTAKTLLPVDGAAVTLPTGQTALQDLNGALDNIFAQPSMAPFVSKQLIQHLVTSNPSAAYVERIANVFNSGTFVGYGATFGSGQRGDLQAVIAAIVLDPEARRGDDPTTANGGDGHLREPILLVASPLRTFGAASDGAGPVTYATNMSQAPLDSPSVFNFFPPDYGIPDTSLLGPEFDLYTAATSLVRANFVNSFVYGSIGSGTTVSFAPYAALAASPDATGQLLDTLNTLLLHGSMSSSDRASILAAVNAVPAGANQNLQRAESAIYLILSSSQFQVEH